MSFRIATATPSSQYPNVVDLHEGRGLIGSITTLPDGVELNFLGRNYALGHHLEVEAKLQKLGYMIDARPCNGGFDRAPKGAAPRERTAQQ